MYKSLFYDVNYLRLEDVIDAEVLRAQFSPNYQQFYVGIYNNDTHKVTREFREYNQPELDDQGDPV